MTAAHETGLIAMSLWHCREPVAVFFPEEAELTDGQGRASAQRGCSMTIKVSARANVRSEASPEKLPSTTQPSPATASATRTRKLAWSDAFQPGRQ
jgi:hypothetical protein